jgi:hypothetical protein
VPITFRDRAFGSSKMTRTIVWEATRRCISLAFERPHVAAPPAPLYPEGAADGR